MKQIPPAPPSIPNILESRLRATVLVTLKSGESFRGVLFEADDRAVVLRNAAALTPGADPTVVDGELIVLLGDVAFFQRV